MLDPKKIIIEHYKRPKQYHSKLLIFLLIVIILFLLCIILYKDKIESGELLGRVMERNNNLLDLKLVKLQKKLELKRELYDCIIETRIYVEAIRLKNMDSQFFSLPPYNQFSAELSSALRKIASVEL